MSQLRHHGADASSPDFRGASARYGAEEADAVPHRGHAWNSFMISSLVVVFEWDLGPSVGTVVVRGPRM
jgi:hypothetical protein